ncbi:MAG: sarcosine oxidase subunit delta [Burkholderiales bacterium]|nr:sarcosine oxidase subunit delta [Burkholderiales bacterium]
MLLIPCPHCGERNEIEFACGGQAHLERPGPQADATRWARYLYYRANPNGTQRERWFHAAGCRRWFNVERDTASHEIRTAYPMGEAPAP